MSGVELNSESILSALSTVQEPELHKDLVTLNMVRDIQIDGGKVSFRLVLTTPACPMRSKIESDAKAAVSSLPGVSQVDIKMDAQVPQDGRSRGLMELPIRNAVAVGSGKGGVGKSTVTVNGIFLRPSSWGYLWPKYPHDDGRRKIA